MFTGIVESTGRISRVDANSRGRRLRVKAPEIAPTLSKGDSISVSGVCLTVEETDGDIFGVFLASETIDRTTLDTLSVDDRVNLERPMAANGRFDGHLVQGHVDGTTSIEEIEPIGDDWRFTFRIPPSIGPYVVEKGSIALDGISLTVAACDEETFEVAIIPETYERTTLSEKRPGDSVHIEVDIIAKYVESMLDGTDYP